MPGTGFPRADVENEFVRARRRQVLAALARRLHFVNDGHHRVSMAAATGQQILDHVWGGLAGWFRVPGAG